MILQMLLFLMTLMTRGRSYHHYSKTLPLITNNTMEYNLTYLLDQGLATEDHLLILLLSADPVRVSCVAILLNFAVFIRYISLHIYAFPFWCFKLFLFLQPWISLILYLYKLLSLSFISPITFLIVANYVFCCFLFARCRRVSGFNYFVLFVTTDKYIENIQKYSRLLQIWNIYTMKYKWHTILALFFSF